MNTHYDEEKARRILFDLNNARGGGLGGGNVPRLSTADFPSLRVADVAYPPSVRLMEDLESGPVEAMFKTYGVICGKVLPPLIGRPYSPSLNNIRNLRQHVRLTGLGSSDFAADADTLSDVHGLFQQHVHDRQVNAFDFTPYEGYACIESHARLFTDRKLVPYDKPQPFLRGVDPDNTLRNLQPPSLIHATDNVVEYCRRVVDDDGTTKYETEDPRVFRDGDIVEIAFSFVGVRIRDSRMMIYLSLRALNLIDDSVRKEAEDAAIMSRMTMDNRTPKRKMRFLSSTPWTDGAHRSLKKYRSEPVLKTAPALLAAGPSTTDSVDRASSVTDASDQSSEDTDSYGSVETGDPSDSSLHSFVFTFPPGGVASDDQVVGSGSESNHEADQYQHVDADSASSVGSGEYDDFDESDLEVPDAWSGQGEAGPHVEEDISVLDDGDNFFDFDVEPMVVDFAGM